MITGLNSTLKKDTKKANTFKINGHQQPSLRLVEQEDGSWISVLLS